MYMLYTYYFKGCIWVAKPETNTDSAKKERYEVSCFPVTFNCVWAVVIFMSRT